MLIRHEKEIEHHRRVSSRKEDELLKRQAAEKRALPKRIRSEMKIREMMFRESLRIHAPGSNPATGPEDEKDRLRKVKPELNWFKRLYTTIIIIHFITICVLFTVPRTREEEVQGRTAALG